MRLLTRAAVVAAFLSTLTAGCGKTDAPSVGTPSGGTPGKPSEESYAKKLVGVWEGTEDMKDGGKPETVTVEFKADGGFKVVMGPFDMAGSWKMTKEEGKTLTVETEVSMPDFGGGKGGKSDTKTFTVAFEDANSIVMTQVGGKPDAKKLKRKS